MDYILIVLVFAFWAAMGLESCASPAWKKAGIANTGLKDLVTGIKCQGKVPCPCAKAEVVRCKLVTRGERKQWEEV